MGDRRIDWKALAIGALADTAGTALFLILFGMLAAAAGDLQHLPTSEMEARLKRPVVTASLMIIGLAFTVLGGYVAGRVSKRSEVLHGALVGMIGIGLGVLSWSSVPPWYDILALVVMVPGGMLGGWIARKRSEAAKQL